MTNRSYFFPIVFLGYIISMLHVLRRPMMVVKLQSLGAHKFTMWARHNWVFIPILGLPKESQQVKINVTQSSASDL